MKSSITERVVEIGGFAYNTDMQIMDAMPIPAGAGVVEHWQRVRIEPCDEPLIPIGLGTEYDDLLTSAVYAGEHLHSPYRGDNAIDAAGTTIYVRRSVAERLRRAQSYLPTGQRLIIFDGYRSLAVQQALFDQFAVVVRQLHPEYTETQVIAATEPYIALPSADPAAPSPHTTGGAVDVAIVQDSRMLEFGTPFDHGSERSALRYFEDSRRVHTRTDKLAQHNRRVLFHAMQTAGMVAYEHEWWHYNAPETQMGAAGIDRQSASFGIAADSLPRAARKQSLTTTLDVKIEQITPH